MFDTSAVHAGFASSNAEDRAAVFTKREVVDFMLDLAGYTVDAPLTTFRILEPSCGEGDFLLSIIQRLLGSISPPMRRNGCMVSLLGPCVRAVELHEASVRKARSRVAELMKEWGMPEEHTTALLDTWIIHADFLLTDLPDDFTHVVGNPPYLRQEAIPTELLRLYRTLYSTMYDRADLYIPFIERGLSKLLPGGKLCYICPDRWMKNKYGQALRAMIAAHYHLDCFVNMVDTDAFHSNVVAYPAITLISASKDRMWTRVAHKPEISAPALSKLAADLRAAEISPQSGITEMKNIAMGAQPWLLHSPDRLALVRRLERNFPPLVEAGCTVGIGVATGADRIYIAAMHELPVERDRLLPLVTTRDIQSGGIQWRGLAVINPYRDDGDLVDLDRYPLLREYLERHRDALLRRNCAKRNSARWYRTIDRIHPGLRATPKLLLPDIKGEANIVHDKGEYYPHHNVYYITSREWDILALRAVLLSGIATLFVSMYSTPMRGGYFRFQAQYIRRIRLPRWDDISPSMKKPLIDAALSGDIDEAREIVFDLYGLSAAERELVRKATRGAIE
jgi:hypothetical protein